MEARAKQPLYSLRNADFALPETPGNRRSRTQISPSTLQIRASNEGNGKLWRELLFTGQYLLANAGANSK